MAGRAPAPPAPDVADVRADRAVLRALVRLASLVTGSHDALSTIESVAETSRELLGAASLSISSRDEGGTSLTTLVNVGDLGPGEVRWPVDERYELATYPLTVARAWCEACEAGRHGTSLSAGVVAVTGGTHLPSVVFGRADRALYAAKAARTAVPVLARP